MMENDLEMVMGNALYYYHANDIRKRYTIPASLKERIMQGTECYTSLSNNNAFIPMVYCYMYKREFLEKNGMNFQQEMYEDELWTIQNVCYAKRIKIIDLYFYNYRQRSGSIMHNQSDVNKQSTSLIILSKNILFFSEKDIFTNENTVREWLYVKAIQMLYYAFLKNVRNKNLKSFYHNNSKYFENITRYNTNFSNNNIKYYFNFYLYNIIQIIKTVI